MEAAIKEAISEFSEKLPADAIRANFEEIYQQSEQDVLSGFLKMELAAEDNEAMKPYMLKLVRSPQICCVSASS